MQMFQNDVLSTFLSGVPWYVFLTEGSLGGIGAMADAHIEIGPHGGDFRPEDTGKDLSKMAAVSGSRRKNTIRG